MEEKNKAVSIIKKAQEDLSSGTISRREFNSIMMTFGAVAGYTLFNSFASAWTGTRMRKSSGVTGYQIQRSLRIRSGASLSKTFTSTGNRQTWTLSAWVKRGKLGLSQNLFMCYSPADNKHTNFLINSSDNIDVYSYDAAGGGAFLWRVTTTQVFRDPSAFYHFVLVLDTTQATAANRFKIYVNGAQVTAFNSSSYPAQNNLEYINVNTSAHRIGAYMGSSDYFEGYVSEVNFIDGQALDSSYFGQINSTTGSWAAKKYVGTYGTNGFYLPFSDTSSTTNLVKDSSSNANNWTPNNISLAAGSTYDSFTDVPFANGTTDRGNYCVLNTLGGCTWNAFPIEGNLKTSTNGNASGNYTNVGTIAAKAKTYFEATIFNCNIGSGGTAGGVGYIDANTLLAGNGYPGSQTNSFGFMPSGGSTAWISKKNGAAATSLTLTGITNGDVIGVAYDPVNGYAWVSKNGVWNGSGNPSTGANPDLSGLISTNNIPAVSPYFDGASVINHICNFGQRPFAYSAPTGFSGLHTGNMPTPTIIKSKSYFDVASYTGTSATRSVSTDGLGNTLTIAPDLVWAKSRSAGSNNHVVFDSVRGVGNYIMPSSNSAEVTNAGMLTAFNTNGFSVGADSTTAINGSALSLIAWMWKAGGAAVTNNSGSVTSQVSANTTSGFSIVTYTGTLSGNGTFTVGHGLGKAPSLIITKSRNATSDSIVMHTSMPSWSHAVFWQYTNGYTDQSTYGTRPAPTSSVFTANYTTGLGINGHTHVAYCFAEIDGFSKFGSYTGNSSSDGAFIYCGFRPKYIMVKWIGGSISSVSNAYWVVLDTTRDTYNASPTHALFIHSVAGEDTSYQEFDILSNGFKARLASSDRSNYSGGVYIFAAFAEAPFKYANAR